MKIRQICVIRVLLLTCFILLLPQIGSAQQGKEVKVMTYNRHYDNPAPESAVGWSSPTAS